MTNREGLTLAAIRSEYQRARAIHSPMNSAHEGYAVILEELDDALGCGQKQRS